MHRLETDRLMLRRALREDEPVLEALFHLEETARWLSPMPAVQEQRMLFVIVEKARDWAFRRPAPRLHAGHPPSPLTRQGLSAHGTVAAPSVLCICSYPNMINKGGRKVNRKKNAGQATFTLSFILR